MVGGREKERAMVGGRGDKDEQRETGGLENKEKRERERETET